MITDFFDFKDKIVFITGGTGGIGGVCVEGFLGAGAKVFFTSSNTEKLVKFNSMLAEKFDEGNFFGQVCNMASTSDIEKAVKVAVSKLGEPNILVCNAGCNDDKLALRMNMESWRHVLDVNLDGNFKLISAIMPMMLRKRCGRIIGVSSVVASTGNPGQINYAASKAGLEGLFRCLAVEIAKRQVTVNIVAPGFIDTPMTHFLTEEHKEKLLERIPNGTFGTPEDVFGAIAFLASNNARYITGQTLHVNGGMYLN